VRRFIAAALAAMRASMTKRRQITTRMAVKALGRGLVLGG
jgi:hypothetical protein